MATECQVVMKIVSTHQLLLVEQLIMILELMVLLVEKIIDEEILQLAKCNSCIVFIV